jgi:hypothetical protein
MAGGEKLSRKQEQAIAALLSESTVEKAAAKAGVGYRTLKLWLTQPDFMAAYRAARRVVMEEAIVVLQKLCTSAALTLGRNLNCGKQASENVAAMAILDRAFKGVDVLDMADRLDALEQAEAARKRRTKQ